MTFILFLACGETVPPVPVEPTGPSLAAGPGAWPIAVPSGPALPATLALTVAPLVAGASSVLGVSGAGTSAPITVWRGNLGGLSCPAELEGWCLPIGNASPIVEGPADAAGSWAGAWSVPMYEPIGGYPVLVATDGAAASLVVMRRVFAGAPADDFSLDGLDVDGFWHVQSVELPPGDYFDLVQEGWEQYDIEARGNETVTLSAVFHEWIEWGDWAQYILPPRASASAEASVDSDGPDHKDDDVTFTMHSLATGTWWVEFGDEYWTPSGYYDMQVRISAPAEPRTWFADDDGDTYGDPDTPIDAPVAPDGVSWRADDCDDSDLDVHPQGWDVCEDGIDQDCTGTDKPCHGAVPVDGLPVGAISTVHSLATGWGKAPLGDVDGDGVAEVWFRDHDRLTLVPLAPGTWGDGTLHANDDDWGQTVAGDFDHDGVCDIAYGRGLIGGTGEVKITATPTDPTSVIGDAWATLVGTNTSDSAGGSLAVGGDVDGDGWGDLVVGGNNGVWLVTQVAPGTTSLALAATATLTPFGRPTPPADLDGDGLADLLIAGPTAAVYHGPVAAPVPGATLSLAWGIAYDTRDLGDTDGDGRGEVLLIDVAGSTFLFEDPQGDLTDDDATHRAETFQVVSATLVDLDRDGLDDLVVTDVLPDWSRQIDLVYGPLPATLFLPDDADVVLPSAEHEQTGQSLYSADYDGDGGEDLAVETYAAPDGDPLNWDWWYATDLVLTGP